MKFFILFFLTSIIFSRLNSATFSNIGVTPVATDYIFVWDCSGCGDGNNISNILVNYGSDCTFGNSAGGAQTVFGDPCSFLTFAFGPIAEPFKYELYVEWTDGGGGNHSSACLTYPEQSPTITPTITISPSPTLTPSPMVSFGNGMCLEPDLTLQ